MLFRIRVRHTSIFNKILNTVSSYTSKMAETAAINRIKANALNAEKEVALLKQQLDELVKLTVDNQMAKLKTENFKLTNEVSRLINQLTVLETSKGIPQISVPGNEKPQVVPQENPTVVVTPSESVTAQPELVKAAQPQPEQDDQSTTPSKNKKKEKAAKTPKAPKEAKEAAPEPEADVGRLDFRVGKIVEVGRHPDADSLYVEKVDCGESNPRTVVSGLVKYVPLEEMQNRMVVVLCNLKPAKMRGVLSEAMVMCASTPERVEVLSPPSGSQPGDLVHCEGYPRQPDAQLNPKKKIFETVAPDLRTDDALVACYKGKALHVPGKGEVVAQTLKNVQVK